MTSKPTFAVDTNILIALWDESDALNIPACRLLESAHSRGLLKISAPVYSELMAHPSRTTTEIDSILSITDIETDWRLEEEIWRTAGAGFQRYVRRRLASTGLFPRRILADFIVGAHAKIRNYTLLTLDERFYNASFPDLQIESF